MTKVYFGCDEIPRHWSQYFTLCNAIELDLDQLDNIPRTKTLNRWRVESPRGFAFKLHVDSAVVDGLNEAAAAERVEFNDAMRKGWENTLERASALAARALILSTPSTFSPGTTSRALIEKFSSELGQEFDRPIIWDAHGMWDTGSTRELARDVGLTYAYDPFLAIRDEIEFLHGDGAFILNERAGMRRDFDRYDIRRLLDSLQPYNRAFVLLRGRFKWEHARLFRDLLGEPS